MGRCIMIVFGRGPAPKDRNTRLGMRLKVPRWVVRVTFIRPERSHMPYTALLRRGDVYVTDTKAVCKFGENWVFDWGS